MKILFLILFTPLCCFIVFLTMPAASLQELVFWKWNASHPETSLDGIHYWFGADDGCSSCLWLPEPLRAFLLQDNNKQQKAMKNPRTGSILWLCMPGTPHRMHTRAAPFSSVLWGAVEWYLKHILPLWKAQCINFQKGQFWLTWHWLTRKKTTLSLQRTSAANSFQNTDGTGSSGPLLSLLYLQATGTAPCQLAKYLQAKNISF